MQIHLHWHHRLLDATLARRGRSRTAYDDLPACLSLAQLGQDERTVHGKATQLPLWQAEDCAGGHGQSLHHRRGRHQQSAKDAMVDEPSLRVIRTRLKNLRVDSSRGIRPPSIECSAAGRTVLRVGRARIQ